MPESMFSAAPFKYERPTGERNKQIVRLARTDRMLASVQVVRHGGENNLHSHPNMDGLWMVLSGRVRFYGEGDTVIGEFGPMEGVLIPRGFAYWFESAGDEVLEILQFEAFSKRIEDIKQVGERVNHEPLRTRLDPSNVATTDARQDH